MIFVLFFSLFIEWKIDKKDPNIKRGTIDVPLDYDHNKNGISLKIPVVISNFQAKNSPILFFGPGNGMGNLPDDFDFSHNSFNDNPIIFIGYRGVDSDPSPSDSEFKSLTRIESKTLDDKLLTKIVNNTQKEFMLSDFWYVNRAKDAISFVKEEKIEYFHILGLGEDGSRIAHYISAKEPKRVLRIAMVAPSVSVPHNDTSVRLLAVIRHKCRQDPSCPFNNVKWLPKDIPDNVYHIFNVQHEKIEFSISHQLRNPRAIPNALDTLQSITDGSSMGYVATSGFSSSEMMNIKWFDFAMHICAKPTDNSLYSMPSIDKICDYLPELKYEIPGKIDQPLLIVSGEFDLPRPKTVFDFYRNMSSIPTIVDQIILNMTSSRFELLRPDVLRTILSYLNDGNTTFSIDPPQTFVWTTNFPATKMLKWVMGSGIVVSGLATIFIFFKSSKEELFPKKPTKKPTLQDVQKELSKMQKDSKKSKRS